MEKTNVIVGGSNVEGNIGSCAIKSENFSKNSWYTTTVAVDSCTGEKVAENTYFDWGVVYFPLVILFFILGLKFLFSSNY